MPVPNDDHEAMISYQEGSQEAFAWLFEQHNKDVLRWCRQTVRNPDDAEDVAQTVWLDLAAYLLKFEPDIPFRNIAYRVARNRSLDWIRNADEGEVLLPHEELERLPLEAQESPETDLLVNDLLKTLDLDERVLILLKVEGYSDEELAEKYDKPVNTIKSDVFRIREKLREARP